jgi:ketosteroid isomerase-like protein
MNAPTPATRASDARLDVIRRAYAAHAAGDLATVFALLHPEVEIVQTPELPWGGCHRGHDGARRFFAALAGWVDAQPRPERWFVAGEDVVACGRLVGRARRDGRPIDLEIVHVWTVRDGQAVRFAAWIDTPAMRRALGLADGGSG